MMSRRVCLLVALALPGCRQLAGLDDPLPLGDGGGGVSKCAGTGVVEVCVPFADMTLALSGTIDTDSVLTCASDVSSGGDGLCVIAADQIVIEDAASVRAIGSRPLVLVARTITVAGTLSVASQEDGARGAGSSFPGCNAGAAPPSGGGGAGGSFGGTGGAGGSPGTNTAGAPLGAPASLRGGCAGDDGGSSSGAPGGAGGGAVALLATETLEVASSGRINASGAGASDGDDQPDSGGAGGGSGGMIVLDAPSVSNEGVVFANGGGGSEGSSTFKGENGEDPTSSGGVGQGGSGGTGGDGGDGSNGTNLDGEPGGPGDPGVYAGGGGGGGAGVIHIHGTVTGGGTVSPPAT